ncbi:MAG: hypothetical protein ACM3ZA_13690 [Bacillota bacterium]
MLHSPDGGSAGHRAFHQMVGLLAGIALLLSATTALAEGQGPIDPAPDLAFEQMGLSVMPEYDQGAPQVLVIIKGSLVNRGSQAIAGKDIVLRAPKGATWTAIAELSSDPLTSSPTYNELRAQARVFTEGDAEVLALRMTKTVGPGEAYPFQAEFYYPGVTGGPDKRVSLAFTPTYSARSLLLDIAEPKGAQAFTAGLGPGQTRQGGDGLVYHNYSLDGLTAGTPFQLDLTYTRGSNAPSLQTPQSAGTPAASGSSANTTAIVMGLLVLAALAGLLLFAGAGRPAPSARGRAARRRAGRERDPVRSAPPRHLSSASGGKADDSKTAGFGPRQKARELLLDGRISQETYNALLAEMDAEEGR